MTLAGPALGVALGLCASVAWAVANIFIHRAARLAGDVVPILWGQAIGAASMLLLLPLWPPTRAPQHPGWLALAGVASALGYFGMFRAFAHGPVSVLTPIISGWAVISATMGVLVFGEVLPPTRAAGALLAIGGVVAIAGWRSEPSGPSGADGWIGPRWHAVGWALGSAVGFGVMVAALNPVAADLGPVGGILGVWGTQWLFLLPAALWMTGGRLLPPRAAIPALVGVGLSEAAGFLAVEVGAMSAPLTVVAPASSVAALVTVLLGRFYLGEAVGWSRAVLAAVVVAGIVLLAAG